MSGWRAALLCLLLAAGAARGQVSETSRLMVPVVPIEAAPPGSGEGTAATVTHYLRPPAPVYPPESRKAGEEGLVLVVVLVDAQGRVEKAQLRRSSGYPRLDAAALEGVKDMLLAPYMEAGVAQRMRATVPIHFSLVNDVPPRRAGLSEP